MTTFADLFTSLKDELAVRYKSPIWGALLISFAACHWRIFVFFFTDTPTSIEAIAFIEHNLTSWSMLSTVFFAMCYAIFFPWFELWVERVSSLGKRARNDFHTEEREREIGRRKLIAQQQAKLIELELQSWSGQSKLADIDLAKNYQSIAQGETFFRWLRDIQNGPINSNLHHTIFNYLNKVDSVEGKFINPEIESAHAKFVSDLSTLNSALSNTRPDDEKRADIIKYSTQALSSHQEYRTKVREQLGI